MRPVILLLSCLGGLEGSVVIDRIAVIVGKTVIKSSDLNRDLRLTEFLNREPLNLSALARRKAAERLIDQQIIRKEIATGGYSRASDADAEALLQNIERDRFGSAPARLDSALQRYGLSEAELRRQLLWQLTVLSFIQQRFQPGVLVSDQEVRAYYDQHRAELQRESPQNGTLAALEPKIRSLLTGEDVNEEFEEWLANARHDTHIEYRQEAFR